jgi:hypothetical protein
MQNTDFPTVNALQPSSGGGVDAFATKINASGSALVYSTYLGGSSNDFGYGIAVDRSGNAYVAGQTNSTDFPTAHALQPSYDGDGDAFLAKIGCHREGDGRVHGSKDETGEGCREAEDSSEDSER